MKLLSTAGSFAVSAAGRSGEGWAQVVSEVVRPELPGVGSRTRSSVCPSAEPGGPSGRPVGRGGGGRALEAGLVLYAEESNARKPEGGRGLESL